MFPMDSVAQVVSWIRKNMTLGANIQSDMALAAR